MTNNKQRVSAAQLLDIDFIRSVEEQSMMKGSNRILRPSDTYSKPAEETKPIVNGQE